jgi:predicted small metal-binding protein
VAATRWPIARDQLAAATRLLAAGAREAEAAEARMVTCHPCGVEFRAQRADQIDELVAAVQQHASGSHGHDVAREHILSELVPA